MGTIEGGMHGRAERKGSVPGHGSGCAFHWVTSTGQKLVYAVAGGRGRAAD